jgi:hypothetical protein
MGAARRFLYCVWHHSPFLLVLALGGALRLLAWNAVSPGWWILGDSISYLYDAEHLRPEVWRPSGYSLLVLWPLLRYHDLALVTAAQHVMGLLVAAGIYVTLLRVGIPRWGALLATIPALFDSYILATEQMLASEALFGALVTGALLAVLWRRNTPGVIGILLAGLLLSLSAVTRVVGLPLIALVVLTLLLRRTNALKVLALCLVFAIPFATYSYWVDHWYGRVNLTVSNGIFTYGRVTEFVDCQRLKFSSDQVRSLCPREPISERNEYYYMFGTDSPLARLHLSFAKTNDVAGQFAVEVIRAQPGDFAKQALEGVVASFSPSQSFGPNDMLFRIYEPLPAFATSVGKDYQGGRDPAPTYNAALIDALARYQDVAFVPGTACALVLALAIAALILGRDPGRRRLRSALVLTAGAAAVLLLVPALTAIPAPRYRVPAIPELCLAAALSGQLLVNRWKAQPLLWRARSVARLRGLALGSSASPDGYHGVGAADGYKGVEVSETVDGR